MNIAPCPNCGRNVLVKEELAGRVLCCPFCKQQVQFPADAPAPGSAAVPVAKRAAFAQEHHSPVADHARGAGLAEEATLPPREGPDSDSVSPSKTEAHEQGHERATPPTVLMEEGLGDLLAPPQGPGELGRLGGYRVLQVLGQGGMGVVFRAEDVQLQRPIALKAMLPSVAANPVNRERFLREARVVAAVEHDHIITIHQVGEDRGVPFLAMPLLRGESLAERLKRESRLPLAEVLRIGREIAEGLAAAHERGLIHRDIKPANIWLEASAGRKSGESRVKILDFGLARAEDDKQLTQSGAVMGTPAYMSPEQTQTGKVDGRSDLFSLGCVLYRLTTGEVPFKGSDTISILLAVTLAEPPPPSKLNNEVLPALETLILQMLAKKPEARPASAQQVAETLEALAAAPPAPLPQKPAAAVDHTVVLEQPKRQTPEKRVARGGRRRWLAAAAVVLLPAVAGLVWMFWPAGEPLPPEQGGAPTVVERPPVRSEPLKEKAPKKSDPVPQPVLRPGNAILQGHTSSVYGVAFSGDGKTLASASQDGTIKLWDVSSAQEKATLRGHVGLVYAVAFSSDGKTLASASADKTIKLWDVASAREKDTLRGHTSTVYAVAFSGDDKTLASGGGLKSKSSFTRSAEIKLWDVAKGQEKASLQGHTGSVWSVAFSSDGKTLASGSTDKTIKLWDVASAREKASLAAHTSAVYAVSFSGDGRALASGSGDSTVKLWDVASAQEKATLKGHLSAVYAVAFSGDGKTLASASHDTTIKWWDVASAQDKATLRGHTSSVKAVSFSSDGRILASGSYDKTVRLWDLLEVRELPLPLLRVDGQLTTSDARDRVRPQCYAKVYPVKLEAGKIYQIDHRSTAFDAYLRLENAAGQQLALDDDSGGNLNARIVFRCPSDGTYRIIATSLGLATGPYTLTVLQQ